MEDSDEKNGGIPPIRLTADDSQFVKTYEYTRDQIARWFLIPERLLTEDRR